MPIKVKIEVNDAETTTSGRIRANNSTTKEILMLIGILENIKITLSSRVNESTVMLEGDSGDKTKKKT